MAIEYELCPLRDDTANAQQSSPPQLVRTGLTKSWDVTVSDPADPTFDPSKVSPLLVQQAPGLPTVNETTYVDDLGNAYPYVVCRRKQCSRIANKVERFRVNTTWDTGTADITEIKAVENPNIPVTPFDYAPKVEESLGEFEIVRYSDLNAKDAVLPASGDYFQQPFVERVPTRVRRVTQYEASLTYEEMRSRKFLCNETPYPFTGGDPRYYWLITDVSGINARVPVQGNLNPGVLVAQVTYTLEKRVLKDVKTSVSPVTFKDFGWQDVRALIDTHYLPVATPGQAIPFILGNELRTRTSGFVLANGEPLSNDTPPVPNDALGPLYDNWEMFRTEDFANFLLI